jgi:hypothetical protein
MTTINLTLPREVSRHEDARSDACCASLNETEHR